MLMEVLAIIKGAILNHQQLQKCTKCTCNGGVAGKAVNKKLACCLNKMYIEENKKVLYHLFSNADEKPGICHDTLVHS